MWGIGLLSLSIKVYIAVNVPKYCKTDSHSKWITQFSSVCGVCVLYIAFLLVIILTIKKTVKSLKKTVNIYIFALKNKNKQKGHIYGHICSFALSTTSSFDQEDTFFLQLHQINPSAAGGLHNLKVSSCIKHSCVHPWVDSYKAFREFNAMKCLLLGELMTVKVISKNLTPVLNLLPYTSLQHVIMSFFHLRLSSKSIIEVKYKYMMINSGS